MFWFLFAFLTALFESLKDVTLKHNLRQIPVQVGAWAWMFFSLPLLWPALLLSGPTLPEGPFWVALAVNGVLNATAISLYTAALQRSDISLTVPMLAFSPLFLLLTAPLIVGELPTFWGIVGVVLVVAGAYLLNVRASHQGYLAPYRALLREPGARLMLAVAFIWSIAATVDKIGVQHSSPLMWAASMNGVIALALTPLMLRVPGSLGNVRARWPLLLLVGSLAGLSVLCQMMAISLTLVAYVIAIKRTSILLGVVLGALLFREQGLRERLAGVLVMLLGVLCIVLL